MITLKDTILLLGVVSLVGATTVDRKKCLKRTGLFPKPGSLCKAYYKCTNWIPVEEVCPGDQIFNPIAEWCDWRDTFPCLDKPKRKECPRDNGRFLKPGTKCKIYYDCCYGEPTEKKCPYDQLFDPKVEKCEWSELYTCVEQPKRKECPKENGLFLKPGTNCKRYYDCRNGEPRERECRSDELFDPSTGRCEWSELYTCVESLSTGVPTLNTISTLFKTSTSATSDDNQNYKTSERNTPLTSSKPNTPSSTAYTRTTGFSETTNQPHLRSSSITEPQPNTRSSQGIRSSTAYTRTTGFPETTNQPHLRSSSITEPHPNTRSSSGIRSSTAYPRTSDFSDYETTNQPHLGSSSNTEPQPNTRSSPGIRSSTAYTRMTGFSEKTNQPHLRSSSNTEPHPNTRSSPGIRSSTAYTRITGFSDYETSQTHQGSSSYTVSESDIQSSTTEMGSSISDVESTTYVDIWCPEPFGYFPHPTDKHKFVGCVNNVPSVLTCPANLVYNHKKRQCDYQ